MIKWMLRVAALSAAALAGDGLARADDLVRLEGSPVRWPASTIGGPTEITFATLTGPFALPIGKSTLSADNCDAMGPFADILAASPDLTAERAKRELEAAFAAWEAAANVKFVEVTDLDRADIIVGSTLGAGGRAFANLSLSGMPGSRSIAKALGALGGASASAPRGRGTSREADPAGGGPVVAIEQAYVCANPRMKWKVGFDGNLDIYDLRYTFMHEIGHAIGLDHPGSTGSIMGYRYDERVRELQPSDIAAIQGLYGPPVRK